MSLLDRFREGTEFNSVGRFTLDESRARKKMSRYQLVQVEEFLLLVVQAVVAAQCQSVSVILEDNLIRLEATRTTIEAEKLARLEDFLFDTREEAVPYYLIGVAENAVEPSCEEKPNLSVSDGAFVFEARTTKVYHSIPDLVRDRLHYLNCPLTLNGNLVSTTPLNGVDQVRMNDTYYSPVILIRYGVIVAKLQLEYDLNFAAVVEDNSLTLDASFSDVVKDDHYAAVLQRLEGEVNEELAKVAREHQPDGPDEALLLRRLILDLPEPAGLALRECPLFPIADRMGYCSWNDIQDELNSHGRLLISGKRFNLQLDGLVVHEHTKLHSQTLRSMTDVGLLEDAEVAYLRKVEAMRNKQAWEESPRPTQLIPGDYSVRKMIAGVKWQAEIGFLGPPGGLSAVDILYKGKLLCSQSLSAVPPGAAVVLNLDEVDIDELWSRPMGRRYRTALKSVRNKLYDLFNSQTFTDQEQLYPALVEYLQDLLCRKEAPPHIACEAPLFETLEGKKLSLEQVRSLPRILLGEPTTYSSKLPPHLIPKDVLLYSALADRMLRLRVRNREDFRDSQQRLQELGQQLENPQTTELPKHSYWLKTESSDGPFRGEVGLEQAQTQRLTIELLHQGAVFETVKAQSMKVFAGVARVESDSLTPNYDWTGFLENEAYFELLKSVKAEARKLEVKALRDPDTAPATVLTLLQAYPQPIDDYGERKLFQSTLPGRLYSMNELKAEYETHGCLLFGEYGVTLPDRLVVCAPITRQLKELFKRALGSVRWENAWDLVQQRQREDSFQARLVHSEIKLEEYGAVRLPVASGRGEVLVFCNTNRAADHVECYFTGRKVCTKRKLLPRGCAAALDSDRFILSEDFQDVEIPADVLAELRLLCALGMLQLLGEDNSERRLYALEYFATKQPPEEILPEFEDLQIFDLQGGEKCSVADLRSLGQAPGYVSPTFAADVSAGDNLVLRLADLEITSLRKILKRQLREVSAELLANHRVAQYRASLPNSIDPNCFQRELQGDHVQGVIGIHPGHDQVVGRDSKGAPLGYIKPAWLPVVGVVNGAKVRSGKKSDDPAATFPVKAFNEFTAAVDQLYLDWAEALSHSGLDANSRSHALKVLNLTKRELGSQQRHPQAQLANTLWDIPLFLRVDGTWISGEALTETFGETEEPLQLTETKRRAPDFALLLEAGSVSYVILHAVFGDNGVHWYQAPPLVDPEKVKESVKQLVSWGLAPFAIARSKFRKLATTIEEKVPKKPVEKKPKSKKKKKEKKKKKKVVKKTLSPEELFIQQMKDEVRNLLGRQHLSRSDGFFQKAKVGSWVLGPPVYLAPQGGGYHFNRSHSSVRWLINEQGDSKARRLARVLLLVHWVGLVNISSEQLTDRHEEEFLTHLTERLLQTFG